MVNLDICYTRIVSLGLDLKILFLTFPAVIGQTRVAAGQNRPRRGLTFS